MSAAVWSTPFTSGHIGAAHVPGLAPPPRERQALVWRDPVPAAAGMGTADPSWWWLGAHGGAGVSTLTALIAGSADVQRMWPGGHPGQCVNVVLVARTHTEGLERARDLAAQYSARFVPPPIRLLGLVTIADAPGRLPTPLRRLRNLVSAAVPQAWHLPWIPEWRTTRLAELPQWQPATPAGPGAATANTPTALLPPAYLACAEELTELASAGPATG